MTVTQMHEGCESWALADIEESWRCITLEEIFFCLLLLF